MLKVATHGTPYVRGEQQGRACAGLAQRWIDRALLGIRERLDPARVRREVDALRRAQAEHCPDIHEECLGIAAGLGMEPEGYFAAAFCYRLLGNTTNCTTVGFHAGGRALLGKTDDILHHELGSNILEVTTPESGYRHLHFHFSGSVWSVAGLNECGLAMAMTGIPGPSAPGGLSSLDALHTILPACATVAEAEAWVRGLPVHHYGFSVLVGDAGGEVALLEKTHADTLRLPLLPGGFVAHTNHILDPEFAARNPSQKEPVHTNGVRRYRNVLRLMPGLPHSEAGLRALLTDRDPDGAICQHGEDGLYTDLAILMLPAARQVSYRSGYPGHAGADTAWRTEVLE